MKKMKYFAFIALAGLFVACEKDETKVIFSDSPVVPTLQTVPDLTLKRADGNKTIEFTGTEVDPGFMASATYILEIAKSGTNFADPVTIFSGAFPASMKTTITDLNAALLTKFTADQQASADLRLRAQLVVDAGTGARGTSANPIEYLSPVKTVNVTPYGLPRLDLINSGITQKVESALGDGIYLGYVKLDAAKPFTIKDPDTNVIYGGANDKLAVNGAALVAGVSGWHRLTVNTKLLTYELKEYRIGLIGSATPNGWNAPDSKMEYNPVSGAWTITVDLVVGHIKFRANDDWSSGIINLGIGDAENPQYTLNNLWNDGKSKDIPIDAAGNYTITLFMRSSGYSATIKKN